LTLRGLIVATIHLLPVDTMTNFPGTEFAFVDYIHTASATAEEALAPSGNWARISFSAGRSGLLDLSTERGEVWADVLASLQQQEAPAYIEIDPASSQITRLLIPQVVNVGSIKPKDQGVEVELIISHAIHFLRATHPRYQELLRLLRSAQASGQQVAVTEDPSSHEILLVTPLAAPRGSPEATAAGIPPEAEAPIGIQSVVTLAVARQMFNLMNSKVCCPTSPASPCIPFSYPDDGCWGRAHEMFRLMGLQGVACDKVWIYGNLRAATTNNPRCEVRWGWHVAPTLRVNVAGSTQTYVIDPSLFTGPVTQATWAGVQGDPAAQLVATPGSVFYRSSSGTTQLDPSFTQTNQVLTQYRNNLRLRSVGGDGPPPYLPCMPGSTGVQFRGTLAAGATQTWFTYGWPARWHVLWTVVPLTTCPGTVQVKWRTRIERADATNATYWIAVTNTSNATVRFEARYDILSR
jgi:hypothetical protein